VVLRLGPAGRTGLIDLPRVADELYRTARVLRLFTLGGRRQVGAEALAELATATSAAVAARIERGGGLLSGGVGGAPAERS
jgi:hypothetical protein